MDHLMAEYSGTYGPGWDLSSPPGRVKTTFSGPLMEVFALDGPSRWKRPPERVSVSIVRP